MWPIARTLGIRFLRQKAWLLALVLPAAAAAIAAASAGDGQGPLAAARSLLTWLHLVVPAAAGLFVLAPSADARTDLLLVRPVSWPAILSARWAGAVAAFGTCHLLLALGGAAALAASAGGPSGVIERLPDRRAVAVPGSGEVPAARFLRPWPRPPVDPAWLGEVAKGPSWTFTFSGLPPGRPCRIQAQALIARLVVETRETGDRSPEGTTPKSEVLSELARVNSAWARVAVLPESGGEPVPAARIELRDGIPCDLDLPAQAVGPSGRLMVVLSPEPEEVMSTGEVRWGPRFFWFDPGTASAPLQARDVRVVAGELPFAANVLAAALASFAPLFLVTALAAAAGSLFSAPVAFACTAAVFFLACSKPFLVSVLDSLSHESSLVLLTDPLGSHVHSPEGPGLFDRALAGFLRGSAAVLPDLAAWDGSTRVSRGMAIPPAAVLSALAGGAAYAAAFLAGAAGILHVLRRRGTSPGGRP